MRRPRDFTKSILLCQSVITVAYVVIGSVIYYFAGQFVASPAMGSTNELMKRISYGLVLPALLVSGMLFNHIGAKYAFVRFLRGTRDLTHNTWRHWTVWLACCTVMATVAFLIATAIPFFDSLLSLIGASLGTFMVLILNACMWVSDHKTAIKTGRTRKLMGLLVLSVTTIAVGLFILGAGTWSVPRLH
jgi:hypothetical protein